MLPAMQQKFIELAKKLNISSDLVTKIEDEFKASDSNSNNTDNNGSADMGNNMDNKWTVGVTIVDIKTPWDNPTPDDIDKMTPDELKAYAKKMAWQKSEKWSNDQNLQNKLMNKNWY